MNGISNDDSPNQYFLSQINLLFQNVVEKFPGGKIAFLDKFSTLGSDLERIGFISEWYSWNPPEKDLILTEISTKNCKLPNGTPETAQKLQLEIPLEEIEKCREFIFENIFKLQSPNPRIPSAEDFIQIQISPERGRHLTCTTDIPPGKTLIVEDPFVHSLQNDAQNCTNCLEKLPQNPFICPKCSMANFCNENCSESAKSHTIECPALPYLKLLGVGHLELLVFRLICSINPKDLNEIRNAHDSESPEFIYGTNSQGIFDSKSYLPIYHWISHINRSEVLQTFIKAFKSFVFAKALCHFSREFADQFRDSIPFEDFELFIGSLFLRHMFNLSCNSYHIKQVKEFDFTREGIENMKDEAIGVGSYPLTGLINHSCDPNVAKFVMRGGKMAVVSIKPIEKGEEILTTYFGHYFEKDFLQRRRSLAQSQYFICRCKACVEQWPLKSELIRIKPEFKCCGNISRKSCKKCGANLQNIFAGMLEKLDKCKNNILNGRIIQTLPEIIDCMEYFQSKVVQPNIFSLLAEEVYKNAIYLMINLVKREF